MLLVVVAGREIEAGSDFPERVAEKFFFNPLQLDLEHTSMEEGVHEKVRPASLRLTRALPCLPSECHKGSPSLPLTITLPSILFYTRSWWIYISVLLLCFSIAKGEAVS